MKRRRSEVKPTTAHSNLESEYLKFSHIHNGSNLNVLSDQKNSVRGPAVAFVISSLLAITGHATNILDRFGSTFGTLLKYGLDAISLTLGTIAAAGYLSDDASNEEPNTGINN